MFPKSIVPKLCSKNFDGVALGTSINKDGAGFGNATGCDEQSHYYCCNDAEYAFWPCPPFRYHSMSCVPSGEQAGNDRTHHVTPKKAETFVEKKNRFVG